ncbi:sigma-70 family RNA polymerase sigma factor [Congregicoccus parvus]|uniref:RNA polymerase sigma factor n=1 Tax=Congregicoccus parvus TaxID=3081749 RepID=UPI003FA556BD
MNTLPSSCSTLSDDELALRSAAGDHEAFAGIVSRYKTLVCSVTYSGTGSLARSEDLAQETFVAAWKQLRHLREPGKLRGWLCGIARNLVRNNRRSSRREPVAEAVEFEALHEPVDAATLPSDEAVNREQEAILWRALERVPETYREPLVLYYREEKSVARVAAELGLSEDAVKQRLARGRRHLHDEVTAFVEGALARTVPGEVFTTQVMGALPLFVGSGLASAGAASGAATGVSAGVGGGAAKGGLLGGVGGIAGFVLTVLGPVLGLLGAWAGVRASLEGAKTRREREYVVRFLKQIGIGVVVFAVVMGLVTAGLRSWGVLDALGWAVLALGLSVGYLGWVSVLAFHAKRRLREIRIEERRSHPEAFVGEEQTVFGRFREYRSRAHFLGLPLVHVRLGNPPDAKRTAACGWIAIGDEAYGVLVAIGGIAVGGISVGGISAGLLSIGGASLGAFAVGGLAIGGWAVGGAALGVVATGGIALAWTAAEGGYAAAREFALGAHASAAEANTAAASDYFAARPWMDVRSTLGKLVLSLIWLPSVFVLVRYLRMRDGRKRTPASSA